MIVYFDAEYSFALKVNNEFLGIKEKEKIKAEIPKNSFIEISLKNSYKTFNLFLDDNFFIFPPKFCNVVNLNGGYLIKLNNVYNFSFTVVEQQKFDNFLITVYKENQLNVSIESPLGFFVDTFDLDCESAKIEHFFCSVPFIAIVFYNKGKKTLCLYSVTDKITKEFFGNISDYGLEPEFYIINEHRDIVKHCVKTEFYYKDKLTVKSKTVTKRKEYQKGEYIKDVLGYLFFEELLNGNEPEIYLSENLRENFDKLMEFIGEYIAVLTPSEFRAYNEIGLLKKEKDNVYYIDYYVTETENDLIVNLKKTTD